MRNLVAKVGDNNDGEEKEAMVLEVSKFDDYE